VENPLAEVAWGSFVSASFVPAQQWFLAAKAPTLVAFVVLLGALCKAALSNLSASFVTARR
jgi:hypothetical protein